MKLLNLLPAAALALFVSVGFTPTTATATTLSVGQPLFVGDTFGSRYKDDRGGGHHYVGTNNLGTPANRTETNQNRYVIGDNTFALGYSAASGLFTSVFNDKSITYQGPAGLSFDTIGLFVNDSHSTSALNVTSLTVAGDVINTSILTGNSIGNNGGTWYTLSGFSWVNDFLLTGTVNKVGALGGNEGSRVEFAVGVIPVPLGLPMIATAFAGAFLIFGRKRRAAAAA